MSDEVHELPYLLEEVKEKGKSFLALPTTDTVSAYRKAVSQFLHRAVSLSVEAEHHVSEGSIRKKKHYTLLKVVNEELTLLIAETLKSESEALQLLKRVQHIEGLLVDFIG